MSSFGFRPHFSEQLDGALAEVQAGIVREVERAGECCEVKDFPGFIALRIPEAERHFWSPRLTLHFSEAGEGRTRIEGIYGPNANVWAMFLFGYLLVFAIWLEVEEPDWLVF